MNEFEKKELAFQSTDIAISAIGSLIGFAIGGPLGAITGSTVSPTSKLAIKVGQIWLKRRKERLTTIVEQAFILSGKQETDILQEMLDSPEWSNEMMSMIQQLLDTDPELDALFSEIMASAISANNEDERNRIIVLNDSIKGMNKVQIQILKAVYTAGGFLSALDMAKQIKVPEFELRNAVRDLELRGMILDNGVEPTIWKLRELGIILIETLKTVNVMEVKKDEN